MSIISTNKTRWGLFALVLMSSAVSFGQFSGACFQYDAAGNRIKRSACQIETVPPEEKSPGSYSEFLALPNSTLAESGAISANVSKKGEVFIKLGLVTPLVFIVKLMHVRIVVPLSLQIRLISGGLEPLLSHTE